MPNPQTHQPSTLILTLTTLIALTTSPNVIDTDNALTMVIPDASACSETFWDLPIMQLDMQKVFQSMGVNNVEELNSVMFGVSLSYAGLIFPDPVVYYNMTSDQQVTTNAAGMQVVPKLDTNGENILRYKMVTVGHEVTFSDRSLVQFTIMLRTFKGIYVATRKFITPIPWDPEENRIENNGRYYSKDTCNDITLTFLCPYYEPLLQLYVWKEAFYKDDPDRKYEWLDFSKKEGISKTFDPNLELGYLRFFDFEPTYDSEGKTEIRIYGNDHPTSVTPLYKQRTYNGFQELEISDIMSSTDSRPRKKYTYWICGVAGSARYNTNYFGLGIKGQPYHEVSRRFAITYNGMPVKIKYGEATLTNQVKTKPWELNIAGVSITQIQVPSDGLTGAALRVDSSAIGQKIKFESTYYVASSLDDTVGTLQTVTQESMVGEYGKVYVSYPKWTMMWKEFTFKASGDSYWRSGEMFWEIFFIDHNDEFNISERIPFRFDVTPLKFDNLDQNGVSTEVIWDIKGLNSDENTLEIFLLFSPQDNPIVKEKLSLLISGRGYFNFHRFSKYFKNPEEEEWKNLIDYDGVTYEGGFNLIGPLESGVILRGFEIITNEESAFLGQQMLNNLESAVQNYKKEFAYFKLKLIDLQPMSDEDITITIMRDLDESQIFRQDYPAPHVSKPEIIGIKKYRVDVDPIMSKIEFAVEFYEHQIFYISFLDLVFRVPDPYFGITNYMHCEMTSVPDKSGMEAMVRVSTNDKQEYFEDGLRFNIRNFLTVASFGSILRTIPLSSTVMDSPDWLKITCLFNSTIDYMPSQSNFIISIVDATNSEYKGSLEKTVWENIPSYWNLTGCPDNCDKCLFKRTPKTCKECKTGHVLENGACISEADKETLVQIEEEEGTKQILEDLFAELDLDQLDTMVPDDTSINPDDNASTTQDTIVYTESGNIETTITRTYNSKKIGANLDKILAVLPEEDREEEVKIVEEMKMIADDLGTVETQKVKLQQEEAVYEEQVQNTEITAVKTAVTETASQVASGVVTQASFASQLNPAALSAPGASAMVSVTTYTGGFKAMKERKLVAEASKRLVVSIVDKQSQRPSTKLLNSLKDKYARMLSESGPKHQPRLPNNDSSKYDNGLDNQTHSNNPTNKAKNIQAPPPAWNHLKCGNHLTKLKSDMKRHEIKLVVEKISRGETICEQDLSLTPKWYSHCAGTWTKARTAMRIIWDFNTGVKILKKSTANSPPGTQRVLAEVPTSEVSSDDLSQSQVVFKLVIFAGLPIFYLLMNIFLAIWFFHRMKNKALRHISIWGAQTNGPVFFIIYALLGASCCMWVFAFNYFKLYFKLFTSTKEIKSFKWTFKIILWAGFVNNLVLFAGSLSYAILTGFGGQPISVFMMMAFSGLACIANLGFSFTIKTGKTGMSKTFFVKSQECNQAPLAFCRMVDRKNSSLKTKGKGSKPKANIGSNEDKSLQNLDPNVAGNNTDKKNRNSKARTHNIYSSKHSVNTIADDVDPFETRMYQKIPNCENILERLIDSQDGSVVCSQNGRSSRSKDLGRFVMVLNKSDKEGLGGGL